MSRRIAAIVIMLAFAAVPLVAKVFDQPYYLTLFGRILVFAIAALSVNLLLGYAGLVSFGHAMFLGIGAYAVGIAGYYGVQSGFVQWPLGLRPPRSPDLPSAQSRCASPASISS